MEQHALHGSQETSQERHASWAELFFDLVAVAGVAAFAHLLQPPSVDRFALFVIGFGAFWTAWLAFMLYGSVAGDDVGPGRYLRGMLGLAVMAAAVPGLEETFGHGLAGHHDRPVQVVAFAAAYVLTRGLAAASWRRGDLVPDWPSAQRMTGTIPWLVSIWTPLEWTLWLWGLGLLIDLMTMLFISRKDVLEHAEDRLAQLRDSPRKAEWLDDFTGFTPVSFDAGHLGERLGLFVIIVLGEGVIQAVAAAAGASWDWALAGTGTAALVLLTGLWSLSVLRGHAGVPLLQSGSLPQRAELALHGPTVASLVVVAAALGELVPSGHEVPESSTRWLLYLGLATYFGLGVLANLAAGRLGRVRLLLWAGTGVVVPVLLAAFGDRLLGLGLAWYAAAVVALHDRLGARRDRPDRPDQPTTAPSG